MPFFEMLREDHDSIRDLLGDLDTMPEISLEGRDDFFDDLRTAILHHFHVEEYAFFPRSLLNPETEGFVEQAADDHAAMRKLLHELERIPKDSAEWGTKIETLRRTMEQHFFDEEENLFPRAETHLSGEEKKRIAERVKRAREAFM